jgi:hypothetical protein
MRFNRIKSGAPYCPKVPPLVLVRRNEQEKQRTLYELSVLKR